MSKTIGMWMYQNGGGTKIEKKMINLLRERDIFVINNLDLRFAESSNEGIILNNVNMFSLDLFFSYNAGEQTTAQLYQYQTLGRTIPMINNYDSFALAEDKMRSALALNQENVRTSDFYMCHRERPEGLYEKLKEWGKMVYKPVDGWGGAGLALIENPEGLDALMPSINQGDNRHIYVERFIENDYSDFRVDIVDGHFISCYGRKANDREWRTNITSGGSVILRDANDEIIDVAKRATAATGLEIAGVDILYDKEREEYVVLEVNGIPAFATPEQEEFGLNFNDLKIEKIVDLIDRTVNK